MASKEIIYKTFKSLNRVKLLDPNSHQSIKLMMIWVWQMAGLLPLLAQNHVAAPTDSGVQSFTNFAIYAGSASCRECHTNAFLAWAGSHHAQAERPVQAYLDQPGFTPARELKHGTLKSVALWVNGRAEIASIGISNRWQTNQADRVIGENPLRQFLMPFPGGRWQVQEMSYDPRTNDWFNSFGEEDRRPGEWGHWMGRGMNWNSMCATCHNTRYQKNYNADTDAYHAAMAEMTVGCEACHGPLKSHVDWQKKYGGHDQEDPTLTKFTRQQGFETCAPCHARRADLTGDFKPGDLFFDNFDLTIVDGSDLFYPDGQIHDEDYEFTAFLSSRMHDKGVRCMDCHDSHTMKTKLSGNVLCLQCHAPGMQNAPNIDPVAHAHHKVFGYETNGVMTNAVASYLTSAVSESGGECVNCHMPQTVYMQRHWRHDHGFTSPDPLLTQQFGIPNACNRCHADKSTDWALTNCVTWYGDKLQRHSRERARVIALARRGDDSVRTNLVALLQTEESPYWRAVSAGLLLNGAGDKAATEALIKGLTDTNPMVRGVCVRTLSAFAGEEPVAMALRQKLADPVRNVRINAAWALRDSLNTNSRAGRDLLRMLSYNADQPAGQLQIGALDDSRNATKSALAHWQKAVEWDAYSPVLRQTLAVGLSAAGRNAEAIIQLEAAVKLAPKDPESHYRLALACNEMGDLKRTVKELLTTVELEPKFARAWYNLGLAQNAQGDTVSALQSLIRAESAEPLDPAVPYARAMILARLGRNAEAQIALRRVLEIQPAFIAARSLLDQLSRPEPPAK